MFASSANSFTLLESPSVTRLLFLSFLRTTSLGQHAKKSVWQYYRTLFQPTPPVHALQVRYQKTRGERFYAKAPAAQQLPSEVRLFLFGSSHIEIDMIAAQMQIFVYAASGSLLYEGHTVSELRDHFSTLLATHNNRALPPNYVKQLFNVFLNTSAGKVIT